MKHVIEYITVDELAIRDLDRKVNEMISKGYQPYGLLLAVGGSRFLQPMVKYASEAPDLNPVTDQ